MNTQPASSSHWLDLDPTRLRERVAEFVAECEEPSYRTDQILNQLLERRNPRPSTWSNVPPRLRSALEKGPLSEALTMTSRAVSTDGTIKYGFQIQGGALIESVFIPTEDRGTLCVSSQAGCPAGCTFCATAASGYRRNLTPAEIVSQWLTVDADVEPLGRRVTNVVFMGMGEPLLNYDAVKSTLQVMTSAEGFGFGPRRITVSTVGVAHRFEDLIHDFPQVRLALSLHSAINATRSQIVPFNRKYDVDALEHALSEIRPEARRVTLEYVVLPSVNDAREEAIALAEFASTTHSHVNLLPFHPFEGSHYRAPTNPEMQTFVRYLRDAGFDGDVTIRRSRGLDIQGACGQLALDRQEKRP